MLSLIVARDRNGAIGRGGDIPWQIPEDLAFFQRETTGGAIIMGRRTWHSLPFRPLKNRMNIVVTSGEAEGAHAVVRSVKAAIDAARQAGHARLYGIGGAGIYKDMLALADRLLITEVDLRVEDADTWFPEFSEQDWRAGLRFDLCGQGPRCEMVEYLRRQN